MPVGTQIRYWGIAAVIFLFVLWWLGNIILPFVLGGAIAYALDPLADRLERLGLSRVWATSVITLFAAVVFIALAVVVVPILFNQTSALIDALPDIAGKLQAWVNRTIPAMGEPDSAVRQSLAGIGESLKSRALDLFNTILASVSGLVNVLVLFVIVPIVTFYLLLDWDNIVAKIDALLPREHAPVVRRLALDIDRTLASFIRGQGTVCLIVGVFYSAALMLIGLKFGLVVGAIAGALTFIPYVGALVGGGLALGLALFQFWGDWVWVIAVIVIFQAGQLVEGNILTPKLVGSSVGLHPVWLIFALSAFGALFGFVGLLVAVPVAASFGVLTRFALDQYRDSRLYRGQDSGPDA